MAKLLSPMYDVVFKLLFADSHAENEVLLRSLLSAVLDIPKEELGEIEYLNTEMLGEEIDDKYSRLDLRLKVGGRKVDIEIQRHFQGDYQKRAFYYWSGMYRQNLKKGSEYRELLPTILINLLDFEIFDWPWYHSIIKTFECTHQQPFESDLRIDFLELPKVLKEDLNTADEKLLWMKFFKSRTEEEFMMLERTGPAEIRTAASRVRHYSYDEKIRYLAEKEEERLHEEASLLHTSERKGIEKGIAQGMQLGIQTEKLETARKLLQKRFDIATISEITGLTEEQIAELLKETDIEIADNIQ